ncbi:DUF4856 domain-containing protein [Flavobacterium sp. CAU 1735]|uniref:DUF4856 domain-containing protein n=1 Tax=Flavobacterium sp. CAU 1735 TaxID=3140361 RepID=UPI003260A593
MTVSCSNDSNEAPVATDKKTTADPTRALMAVKMLAEFDAYTKKTQLYPLDAARLKGMYTNTGNPFSDPVLNTSGVSLKEKTAENAKLQFDFLFEKMGDVALAHQSPASKGHIGSYTGSSGISVRLFNEKGLEINQAIIKGLMGAVLLNQTLNSSLNTASLDAMANNAERVKLWEEGYTYIFGYKGPDNTKKYFWESYLNTVNGNSNFAGITQEVIQAFEKGKEAILAGNNVERDKQIQIIKEKLSKVGAIRAVYYMQKSKGKLSGSNVITGDMAAAFHGLSEAYGFISALAYTNNPETNEPYLLKSKTEEMTKKLLGGDDGFWDANYTATQIDILSETIANAFGFTVAQATAQSGSH